MVDVAPSGKLPLYTTFRILVATVPAYQEMYIENPMGSLDSRKVMVYLDMEEMNG